MASIRVKENRHGISYVVMWRDEQGRQVSRTFDNPLDANRAKDVVESPNTDTATALQLIDEEQPSASESIPAPVTLADFLTSYVGSLSGVTQGTRATYEAFIRWGYGDMVGLPVETVQRTHVSAWVTELISSGLSAKTIRNRQGFASAAYAWGMDEGLATTNPFRRAAIPRTDHQTKELCFLEPEEVGQLLSYIDPRYRDFVWFLVVTGARFGEVTALRVGDVDLARGTVRVNRAWQYTGKAKRTIGPTKTARSNRTLTVDQITLDMLARQTRHRTPDELLFPSADGYSPIIQVSFYKRVWAPAVRRLAGDIIGRRPIQDGKRTEEYTVTKGPGKHPRVHDLRHTYASTALDSGVDMFTISRSLGHESISTTTDIYGHLLSGKFADLAAAVTRKLHYPGGDTHTASIEAGTIISGQIVKAHTERITD